MTWKFTVVVLIGIAVVARSQERGTKAIASKSFSTGLPIPRFEKGTVEGKTYKNSSVGFEMTVPLNFEFGSPEVKGSPNTVPLVVTVSAMGVEPWPFFKSVIGFYADALAYYPVYDRSTADYVRSIVREEQRQGFKRVTDAVTTNWDAVSFSRVDFWKSPAYEAVLVKACETQALVFIFSSMNRKVANKLIAGTRLKLNIASSHCHAD